MSQYNGSNGPMGIFEDYCGCDSRSEGKQPRGRLVEIRRGKRDPKWMLDGLKLDVPRPIFNDQWWMSWCVPVVKTVRNELGCYLAEAKRIYDMREIRILPWWKFWS